MPNIRNLSTEHSPSGWSTVACILILAVTAVLMTGIIVTGSTDSVRQVIESLLMLLGAVTAGRAARQLRN